VLCLGVTYKPNVGDIRESAALEVMQHLQRRGAVISYSDPYVDTVDEHGMRLDSQVLDDQVMSAADCVALLTPHDSFDTDAVVAAARLVFDARNALRHRGHSAVVTL
jgi:UDP-N-acetyl-D-glucosamine dehydrogenase